MMLDTVFLREVRSGRLVEAELHGDVADDILDQWDTLWLPAMEKLCEGRAVGEKPEDSHWDWRRKADVWRKLLRYHSFAIVCGGELQGLLVTNDVWASRHPDHFGKPAVYVEFVATAPWNRPEAGAVRYTGVGTVFLATAIQQSDDAGFRGRIALHSLPKAETFYRGQGLVELGRDSSHQNLAYFEMTETGVQKFQKKPGKS